MALRSTSDVYYDPYDVEIDIDPYPVYRRLREEAPLYEHPPVDFAPPDPVVAGRSPAVQAACPS